MKLLPRTGKMITGWYVTLYLAGIFCFRVVPGCDCTRDEMVVAAYHGAAAIIHFLTFLGASPSPVGWEEHRTPLGTAADVGRTDMVVLLLRNGARINERDDFGRIALAIARRNGHTKIARLLEDAGGYE